MKKELIPFVEDLVYDEIFVHNVYNLSINDISNRGVLDLGGHYGLFALLCTQLNAKQVVSVEPNHHNLYKYRENTKHTNVKVICAAVSSKKDSLVTINNEAGASRTGFGTQLVSTISLETLMSLFDSSLDLTLKIDIEGSEYDVFYNNSPDLIKRFSTIVMEAHNYYPIEKGNEAEQLRQYLINLGYDDRINGQFWAGDFIKQYNMAPAYSYKFTKK